MPIVLRHSAAWIPALAAALILGGCSDAADKSSRPGPGTAHVEVDVALSEAARLCERGAVTAQLSVDEAKPVSVAVDCSEQRVAQRISDLAVGPHAFRLEVLWDGVLIYSHTSEATLIVGSTHRLVFDAPRFADSDGDGFTNLAELLIFGLFSNAWLDANLRPPEDLPRFSQHYLAADHTGESFVGGSAGSTHYRMTIGF
jgi:hypothetical protein